MNPNHFLTLILALTAAALLIILSLSVCIYHKVSSRHRNTADVETSNQKSADLGRESSCSSEDLITFQGGEGLTICDILEAPGEVIGKSSYGTLYKAMLQRSNSVKLLRFLRPACAVRSDEFGDAVRCLGRVRSPNLVPLLGFYGGPRGEKLLVHPFYRRGNLADFVRDANVGSRNWGVIYGISVGLARGLDHLHTGSQRPMIHGNLKSKNILLDRNNRPYISDYGLHILLDPATGQQMLEISAAEGYKAPELIKMRDASEETDIYSLGVIFLELITGKSPINEKASPDEELHLPNYLRRAVLDHRISELYHPDILLIDSCGEISAVTEEHILKFFQLAMACCSPSPSLRPNTRQVLKKLEEIGK
ncbi:putative kinase-like protein TMKL1 [Rhodamnia argentea]|uniref:Kinase-like protein TMKL1 n=1 Tax=Rhodamnia argentea TaxID=178133 RepID=A0A8B8PEC5_9MYRT|nr:putative kinase-like protein TMKL1 [Rhodamnia argentea]